MLIELNENLVEVLTEIARHEKRDINDLVQEMIENHLRERSEDQEFEILLDDLMREHKWLLDELAKQ